MHQPPASAFRCCTVLLAATKQAVKSNAMYKRHGADMLPQGRSRRLPLLTYHCDAERLAFDTKQVVPGFNIHETQGAGGATREAPRSDMPARSVH